MISNGSGASSKLDRRLFAGVETWVFDLDDTLYPRASGLHAQMLARVVLFIQNLTGCDPVSARELHRTYYDRYGTSLVGLQRHHGVDPLAFMSFVHDIDVTPIGTGAALAQKLEALPGRRFVFTNGSRQHAGRIMDHLGISHLFDGICDIEMCQFVGKPDRAAYETFLSGHGIDPTSAAMFDDRAVNLRIPFELGMRTVLVGPEPAYRQEEHIDAVADDLVSFLSCQSRIAGLPKGEDTQTSSLGARKCV